MEITFLRLLQEKVCKRCENYLHHICINDDKCRVAFEAGYNYGFEVVTGSSEEEIFINKRGYSKWKSCI
jgi:hypothetical protein